MAAALVLWGTSPAEARWATLQDVDSIVRLDQSHTRVRADGTYVTELEREIEILKDSARQRLGTVHLQYNSRAAKLEILEARTINPEGVLPVDKAFIEDKPLASVRQGFDQSNQVMVAFPQVRVGSRVRFRARYTAAEIPFAGFFSDDTAFGASGQFIEESHHVYESELPLHAGVHDPGGYLKIKESRSPGGWRVEARLRKPVRIRAAEENDPYFEAERFPWLVVTTTRDWKEMVAPVLPKWEAIVSAPLPPLFDRIAKKASRRADPVERLNAVTSLLADEIHYWGDWRPIHGGHVPRPLETIASSRFGDCKDFAAAITAILRTLGFEAYPAFIKRGARPLLSPVELPDSGAFNHAISFARLGGREFWIDGTNRQSFAQGVFEDLADRPALIADLKNPRLVRTPHPAPAESIHDIRIDFRLENLDRIAARGTKSMAGRAAVDPTGLELGTSWDTIAFGLVTRYARPHRLLEWDVDRENLKSRVVRNLDLEFRFVETGPDERTSAGSAIALPTGPPIEKLLTKLDGRVSSLYLGLPHRVHREQKYLGIRVQGDRPLGCEIETQWVRARRSVSRNDQGAVLTDEVEVRRAVATSKDLASPEFRALRQILENCFDRVSLVYEPAR